jgi:hypothetical protein
MMGLTAETLKTVAAFEAMRVGVDVLGQIGEEAKKTRDEMKQLGDEQIKKSKDFRELSFLTGKSIDQVKAESAEFGMQTGMAVEEAREFRRVYEGAAPAGRQKGNVGQGGRRPGETEEQYRARLEPVEREIQQAVAGTAQRVGIKSETAGRLAGQMSQFQRIPDRATAEAVMGQVVYGLQEGVGEMDPLTKSLMNIAGSVADEDTGAVRSLGELAVMLGVSSTHHEPAEAGTYTRIGIRSLREFKGQQGESLKRMGIGPEDTSMEAMRKLWTELEQREARGQAPDISLSEMGFNEVREVRALTEFYRDRNILEHANRAVLEVQGRRKHEGRGAGIRFEDAARDGERGDSDGAHGGGHGDA